MSTSHDSTTPSAAATARAGAAYREDLPQLHGGTFLTDGGLETSLIFDDHLDLPDFAAFTLLRTEPGRAALASYFERYARIAVAHAFGLVLETPTWRAHPDGLARQGWPEADLARLNVQAAHELAAIRARFETESTPIVISGCIGPRFDGYAPQQAMSADQSRAYHLPLVSAFARSDADLVSALTMTSASEAIGVVLAAREARMPVVVSFTVELDGRLPDGSPLEDAIQQVDDATAGEPAYYMVNCAHPTHFAAAVGASSPAAARLRGVRANASRLSHAELDEAEELDSGDPVELAAQYLQLRSANPGLTVLGGCCGTNHEHIAAIAAALSTADGRRAVPAP